MHRIIEVRGYVVVHVLLLVEKFLKYFYNYLVWLLYNNS